MISSTFKNSFVILLFPFFLGIGCQNVTVGPIGIPAPVIVGQIERIGDTKPRDANRVSAGIFQGKSESKSFGAASQNQYRSGNYVVTETKSYSGSEASNTVENNMRNIWYNSGSHSDDIIYIDEITASTWAHHYIFIATLGVKIDIKGKVLKKQ